AYGMMTLNSITGVTFKGHFNVVTILTDHLAGRGFWRASITGGTDCGHVLWANFEINAPWDYLNPFGRYLGLIQGNFGDLSHTFAASDFSAEFNNQTCSSGSPEVNAAGADAPTLAGAP